MRIDKLSLAALEATLTLYRDPERARREIPVLAMLDVDRARAATPGRADLAPESAPAARSSTPPPPGGGALPLLELEGPAVALTPGAADASSPRGCAPEGRR